MGIGFWGVVYHSYNKESPKIVEATYEGPYNSRITLLASETKRGAELQVCPRQQGSDAVTLEIRVPFRVLLIGVPCYVGDPERDPNLENYPKYRLFLRIEVRLILR